jgi:RimJ/RimL family protein N-acetyltransferase
LKQKTVNRYLSLGPLSSLEHAERLVDNYLQTWNKFSQFNYIIETKEGNPRKKIGSISLWNLNWLHKRAEIGIWLIGSDYFNKGIGTRAVDLIKNMGFIHLKLNRIEAHTAIENVNSIKLFKKCGFNEEGVLKQYIRLQGEFHDAVILSCINPF